MGSSWSEFVSRCKSRLSAIARSCFLRRAHWYTRYLEAKQAQEELQEVVAHCEERCRQLEQKNQDLCQQVLDLRAEVDQPHQIQLPLGDVPSGQQYGANMIALSVNLARKVGIRRTVRALKIF